MSSVIRFNVSVVITACAMSIPMNAHAQREQPKAEHEIMERHTRNVTAIQKKQIAIVRAMPAFQAPTRSRGNSLTAEDRVFLLNLGAGSPGELRPNIHRGESKPIGKRSEEVSRIETAQYLSESELRRPPPDYSLAQHYQNIARAEADRNEQFQLTNNSELLRLRMQRMDYVSRNNSAGADRVHWAIWEKEKEARTSEMYADEARRRAVQSRIDAEGARVMPSRWMGTPQNLDE